MSRLTKKQAQEIIGFLESGQGLPEDYKQLLFPPERKEYELVYAGKEREEEIIANTWGVPLQAVKTFNLTKNTSRPEWTNRLIFGDNLQVMKRLLDDPQVKGKVKLIYIDPPFATKRDFQGNKDQKAYQDKIAGAQFVEFLRKRLVLAKDLLASDGVIFIHLDTKKSHYMKVVLDEVFGEERFKNEVIWKRSTAHSDSETYANLHDTIFLYSKSGIFHFNQLFQPYSDDYIEDRYKHKDPDGRLYLDRDLTAKSLKGGGYEYKWKTITKIWRCPLKTMKKYEKDDRLYYTKKGLARYKQYLDEMPGVSLQDIWVDIFAVNSQAGERVDYPTQKPETLLERLILSTTNENDIVFDFFAGSGTTISVAEKLGRRWIGIDCGKLAIYTMQKRLMNLREGIGQKGKLLKSKPFTLYNAGLYDFKRMSELPWKDYRLFALQLFQVRDKKHTLAGIELDGYKHDADVLVFNFKEYEDVMLDEDYIADLHQHFGTRTRDEFYIIAPASLVTFLEDYIDHGNTRYFILRIPYSIIDELHDRPFQEIRQPVDEADINNTVEAVGFDFIIPPTVKAAYGIEKKSAELFSTATIKIKEFKSEAMTKKPRTFKNRETLSMVVVDYDYKGNGEGVFDLDATFYRDEIEEGGWKVHLDSSQFGAKVMIIYMDIFGNELREVKTPQDFGISADKDREEKSSKKQNIKNRKSKAIKKKASSPKKVTKGSKTTKATRKTTGRPARKGR